MTDHKIIAMAILGIVAVAAIFQLVLIGREITGYTLYEQPMPEQCMQMCSQISYDGPEVLKACTQQCKPWLQSNMPHTAMPVAIVLP